jgi:hypothetical protein
MTLRTRAFPYLSPSSSRAQRERRFESLFSFSSPLALFLNKFTLTKSRKRQLFRDKIIGKGKREQENRFLRAALESISSLKAETVSGNEVVKAKPSDV